MDLVTRATHGDAAAWGSLFAQIFPPIYRFVFFRVSGDVHVTEDVVQETFRAVAISIEQYDPKRGEFLAWCIGIARQQLAAHYRKSKTKRFSGSERTASDLSELDDPCASPDEVISRQEQLLAVGQVFSELPPNYQQVLTLKYIENLSFPSVAESLGLTISATKSLAMRAKEKLRSELKAKAIVSELL